MSEPGATGTDRRQPRFLSSHLGAIDHVLLFAPGHEAEHFAGIYAALINRLPQDCRVSIVAEVHALPHITGWSLETQRRERVSVLSANDLSLTAWARDPALALQSPDAPSLILPFELDRRDDLAAVAYWAKQSNYSAQSADIPFEGGNMLIAGDFVFIGTDSLDAVSAHAITTLIPLHYKIIPIGCADPVPEQLALNVRSGGAKWREIFHHHNRPGTRQPLFHIDMFMSLAGRDADGQPILLIGDPSLAAQILDTSPHPRSLGTCFDAIADTLIAQGMSVIRNPLPMIYMDDVEQRTRTWFYASSNNVLVQQSDSEGDIVWMPQYGHDNWPELEQTDAANRKIWEDLGFDVRFIPDAQKLAENLGGLHCMANVLSRR